MRKSILCMMVVFVLIGLLLVACVPEMKETMGGAVEEQTVVSEGLPENSSLQDVYDAMEQQSKEYAPEIVTMEDGTLVQRTPESSAASIYVGATSPEAALEGPSDDAVDLFDGAPSSYNTYYLNADNRGCESCHKEGLGELVNNISYKHYILDNGLGTVIDVKDCLSCHNGSSWMNYGIQNSLGNLIHGVHSKDSFTGDCMSCHSATADGNGLRLWDEAKYDVLSGIHSIEDVKGDFSYSQDVVGGSMDLLWWPDSSSQEYWNAGFRGDEPDPAAFDSWEITVSGMVDNPFSITLGELIEQAPSETFFSSGQCVLNPPTGEIIGNNEVTGIPISWILEKAGVQDGATTISNIGTDGFSWSNYLNDDSEGWLVYEVNGDRLSYLEGYPVRAWYPEHSLPMSTRWLGEIVIDDREPRVNEGFGIAGVFGGVGNWIGTDDRTVEFYNKPNAAICNIYEGQIISFGKPYTFEGYADGFNEQIVAVEFSLDRGNTWTSFDTSDSDQKKWVYWNFTYTPESRGAYVLSVRAVTDTGRVSFIADEVMVNAK